MITHEQAKELYDAGFPCRFKLNNSITIDSIEKQYLPRLDELIKACGDDFELLRSPYQRNQKGYHEDVYWTAEATNRTGICSNGSTPEEAVARLWLFLNMFFLYYK